MGRGSTAACVGHILTCMYGLQAHARSYTEVISAPTPKRYTVSEITDLIQSLLSEGFPAITIEGEVSNFRPSSTGHLYFSLKDARSMISVVMFRGRAAGLNFQLSDGMTVLARGSISVYARRGTYQLVCDSLTRSGEGDILAMLEERKRRLAAEGLFDSARKKALPMLPARVAVITSPTGAAVRDVLRILKRRHAGIDLVILPSPVQGDEAAEKMCVQIRNANAFKLADVIILSRGGGSLEDLLPFHDEQLVRAIVASSIPVISAVGHETDITLSDLAADVRAPTPSAAAEMVTTSREDLVRRIEALGESMEGAISQKLERVRLLASQFTPENLGRSIVSAVQPLMLRADDAREDLMQVIRERITALRHRLELLTQTLGSSCPLDILRKGYAIVTHEPTGSVLVSTQSVAPGDDLQIRLFEGRMRAEVEEIDQHEEL